MSLLYTFYDENQHRIGVVSDNTTSEEIKQLKQEKPYLDEIIYRKEDMK